MKRVLSVILLLSALGIAQTAAPPESMSRSLGRYYAPSYAFGVAGGPPALKITAGNSATGSQTIQLSSGATAGSDGRAIFPLQVGNTVTVDVGSNAENVTLTAVSNCNTVITGAISPCSITGSFNNLHSAGVPVASSTVGVQEAIDDAFLSGISGAAGGGVVVVDAFWTQIGGTTANITGATVFPQVSIEDDRNSPPRYWNITPTGAAVAAPAVLTGQTACDATHQFCSDSTVAGNASYAGGTLFGCVTYVDIAGNESPCSATNSFTDASAKAIDIKSPAALAGAVGWIPYLSLDGGTYAQAYRITPTSAICTLTNLTPIAACALTNTTYGQTGSTLGKNALFNGGAQITGYPVNTSPHFPALGSTAMTTASLTPITNSSVTYAYAPGNRIGTCQISPANVVNYAASGSTTTAIPNAIAAWTIPANCFNYIGAEFRVSGKFTFTDGGDTSTEVRIAWDSPGTNSTTIPTKLCSVVDTATGTAAAYNGTYYCSVRIATTGATGTALVDGYANLKLAAGATTLVRDSTDVATAASGSINLTADSRVTVYFIGTGATNNPGAQGLAAKFEILN